jgi:hypothetical protein
MLETLDDSLEYKRISYIGVLLFICISAIIQFVLMNLFPMMGLGGIFCMPIAVVVGSIWGFCSVFVLRQRISRKVKTVILLSFFFIQVIFLLHAHPQDTGDALRDTVRFFTT